MKNKIKLLGIIAIVAIIGLSFLSCEGLFGETFVQPTSATLTIRSIPEKIQIDGNDVNVGTVIAYGYDSTGTTGTHMAGKELTKNGDVVTVTYATVNAGAASLQVWKANAGWNQFTAFADPPAEGILFRVVCFETRDELRKTNPNAWGVIGTCTVNFTGTGSTAAGTGNFTAVTPY
jgi:hypothetical protein